MFRITQDPSSGSLVQRLAKFTRMVLSCPFTWTKSMLWQHILSEYAAINTYLVHVNGHNRNILVIFSQALYKAP